MRNIVIAWATALATAAAVATVAPPAFAADWQGNARHAADLVTKTYAKTGLAPAAVKDTGRTFEAGGVVWRLYEVTWKDGGFRHVAVHRRSDGQYVAIEGIETEKKWSHGVALGR